MRRVLTKGCGIQRLKHAQLGLTDEELQEWISTDPDLPWRHDFLKSIDDPANTFWVDKILTETMSDTKVGQSTCTVIMFSYLYF